MNNTIINIIDLTWPMVFISVSIAVSLRVTYLFKNKCELTIYKELLSLFFLVYILSLFQIVTFQDVSWSGSNFIPFTEILRYKLWTKLFLKNVLGNMLMFVPYGFFVSYFLKNKKLLLSFVLIFIASFSIEITQLLIGRVFDIDDIILNIIGGLVGFFIYKLINRFKNKLPKNFKNDMLLNLISVILIIVILIILMFAVKGII